MRHTSGIHSFARRGTEEEQVEQKAVDLDDDDNDVVDKNAIYEEIRLPEKRRIRVSKLARTAASDEFLIAWEEAKITREEAQLAMKESTEAKEATARNALEAAEMRRERHEFNLNMMSFSRDMSQMKTCLAAQGGCLPDSETQDPNA